MASKQSRQRNHKRDRRKAKQSNYTREPRKSNKVGHHQGSNR